LLVDGLAAWEADGHQSEAKLVRRLFFAPDGTPADESLPGRLLDAARRDCGRSKADFEKQRRATFRLFADFLSDYVELGARASRSAVPPEALSTLPPASSSRKRWPYVTGASAIAGGVVVAVVIGLREDGGAPPPATSTSTSTASATASPAAAPALFTFDALGGGSSVIRVFPGVLGTPADLIANGTFFSGQSAPALCKIHGRLVSSDPTVGEQPRQSDLWVEVVGTPGQRQFARVIYGTIDQTALDRLPQCTNVP